MQHRQQHAEAHALLDRERHNGKRSREDQQKLGSASSPHVDHHADAHETERDKEEDAGQRGGGQMGERFAREQENADRRRGRNQSRKLRLAARLRGDRRRRRACIHGKRADETTEGVGRSDADEIPVDVRTFRAVGKRPRRRRCLHHHHERNEHGERRDDVNVVPGNRGQREMGRGAGDRPERRHAFGLETERNRRQPSEAKANESPGKPWADAFAQQA